MKPTRKVLTAIAVWSRYPTEVESDLADRGHDIFDWHRQSMSSRKLLVLLQHAREEDAFKTAMRGGEWPEWQLMLKEIHKEVAVGRASRYVGGDHEYVPKVFLSPTERVEHFETEQAEDDEFDDLVTDLVGE